MQRILILIVSLKDRLSSDIKKADLESAFLFAYNLGFDNAL
jgi:hypothetical protein